MKQQPFIEHLEKISGGKSLRTIGRLTGVPASTLTRQVDTSLKIEVVVAICEYFKAPLLPAMVAAGFITEEQAKAAASTPDLSQFSDEALSAEITRRLTQDPVNPVFEEPIDLNAHRERKADDEEQGGADTQ